MPAAAGRLHRPDADSGGTGPDDYRVDADALPHFAGKPPADAALFQPGLRPGTQRGLCPGAGVVCRRRFRDIGALREAVRIHEEREGCDVPYPEHGGFPDGLRQEAESGYCQTVR